MRKEEEERHQLALNHQKELSTATVEIQERERARIAGELHDDLIAQLYRIKLSNENSTINSMLIESIQKARNISHDLSPPMLEQVSFEIMLLDFLEPFQKKYELEINLHQQCNKSLQKTFKLQLFRIFQEIITNIDKHANANKIEIYYRFYSYYLCLVIRDNGIGFSPLKQTGLGLKNIALRAQILNGSYKIKPHSPQGTTFILLCYDNQ